MCVRGWLVGNRGVGDEKRGTLNILRHILKIDTGFSVFRIHIFLFFHSTLDLITMSLNSMRKSC